MLKPRNHWEPVTVKTYNASADPSDPDDEASFIHPTDAPLARASHPRSPSILPLASAIIFSVIYILPIMPDHPTAHTCLAILSLVCFLWITEAIPPFATAYIIPILSVWLRIGVDPATGRRLPAASLAQYFAFRFMDPLIFVFLGSIALSCALQKLHITTRVSRTILGLVSPRPSTILLVLMLINVTIGAFLSNVASTTLTLSLALPIIRTLNPRDPFIKAMLFGIAWSGNCGGMPTTIASPQNVIAAKVVSDANSPVSFVSWLCFGVPVSLILCFSEWFYLIKRFQGGSDRIPTPPSGREEPWSCKHTEAVVCTAVTIALWTFGDYFAWFMGHIGIASLVPIVWLFGTNILTVNDFNSFKWSTLSLLGGGLVLGEAMKVSGLLDVIALSARTEIGKMSAWTLLVILLVVEGVIASLLSSTTAASIIFPLIMAVGVNTGHPALLVILSSLMISGAQLFHISSFPNALVSGVCIEVLEEDPGRGIVNGVPFLSGNDYVITGAPTIAMGVVVVATIGYGIVSALGY
jgi:anion transporter